MTTREVLLGVANDARGWLRAWAGDFTDADALAGGASGLNPAAWQLGHVAAAQDGVYCLFTGEPGIVPPALEALCGTGRPPPPPDARYPAVAELWELLARTQARLTGLVERTEEAGFSRPPLGASRHFHTLGQAVYEIALHENYHVGMIGALRKLLGKPPIG